MLKNAKIRTLLTLLNLFSLLIVLFIAFDSLSSMHERMFVSRIGKIQSLAQVGQGVVKSFYDREQKGELTRIEAQALAKDEIKKLRYDGEEYFFIYDYNGNGVAHPILPEREGKNFLDAQDENGVYQVREFIKSAKNGTKPVFYKFPKPGSKVAVDKIVVAAGFEPWAWAVCTGLYVDDINASFNQSLIRIGAIFAVILLFQLIVTVILSRAIINPIQGITKLMHTLAGGDTTVEIPHSEAKNEVGELARALEVFKHNAIEENQLEKDRADTRHEHEERSKKLEVLTFNFDESVTKAIATVTQATTKLQGTAKNMSAIADTTASKASAVSKATEETSTSVSTVASAAEELSASISGIENSVKHARTISEVAVDETTKTSKVMQELSENSQKIGDVVQLISEIASQTNLLALNATIEAARAGEAGKGFAVVANEVKSLANQTAKATEDITAHIGAVQASVENAKKSMENVVTNIDQIKQATVAIEAAVGEQSAATEEIAHSVQRVATSAEEVAVNIEGVTKSVGDTDSSAREVLESTQSLSKESESLTGVVRAFLRGVREVEFATIDDAKAMTERAVAYFHKRGKQSFDIFNSGEDGFRDRDIYLFVYDKNGVCLSHGANRALIGKNLIDFKDSRGTPLIRNIVSVVDKGWVEFYWENPQTKKNMKKKSYIIHDGDFWFGVGAYEQE